MLAREVDTAQARVVFGPARAAEQQQHDLATLRPTHIVLLMKTRDGGRYLVDVGLAKYSLTEPLSLNSSEVESTVARGVLSKQFKLRPTTDSPHSEHTTQGYILQVSVPDAAADAERRWQAARRRWGADSAGRDSRRGCWMLLRWAFTMDLNVAMSVWIVSGFDVEIDAFEVAGLRRDDRTRPRCWSW